jgi:mono/diheme cytochrome c family protein
MMKYSWSKKVALSTMTLTVVSGAVFAQTGTFDAGKDEYNTNCAVCHGTDAKGKGPYSAYLRSAPTDLKAKWRRLAG